MDAFGSVVSAHGEQPMFACRYGDDFSAVDASPSALFLFPGARGVNIEHHDTLSKQI